VRSIVLGLAVGLALTAPTFAQFGGAPFGAGYGSPGLYAAPEAAAGAFGGGAANSAASQSQCMQSTGVGRDGPRGNCPPGRVSNPPRR
jgi:hypothetical protein